MKNFLIGLVVGVLLCGLTALILVFAMVRFAGSFANRPVSVADGSTLVLTLEGDVPERLSADIPIPFLQNQTPLSVEQVWDTFRKAAADPRIHGILFEPRGLSIGWAKMQEIHDEILQFKKSGKPIITYLHGPSAREYYLAAATDKIFISPEDSLDLKGLRVESMYFKDTLDKVGVKADVIHAGKYKDAGDILTQTSMTPETREVLNDILDQYYGNLIATVAQDRKKQPDAVRALIDDGPFLARDAAAGGLIDSLGYEDQAVSEMQTRLKQTELQKIGGKAYLKVPLLSAGGGHRIALIVGDGMITQGSGNETADDESFTATGFIKLLKQVENDSSIQGVILRIDSPGGDAVASDDMLHEAKILSKKKPLVISMSDEAASGGYYVAATGDPIIAYPNTLTGSIGVIFARLNLHGLYDKIGVNKQLLSRGRYADIDSDYAPMSDDERKKIAGQIDAFYRAFVGHVAEGRKKPFDQIEPLAQGRVWLGAQAKQNGLVDQLGGLDRAIEILKQQAHLSPSDRVTLVPYPGRRTVFDMLFSRADPTAEVQMRMEKIVGKLPFQALSQRGFLKLMPYSISIH
ncbi:MAG TPA: signal peptide peptidase SppA [Bryobacteraceae bacterium]|jgi:protease IV|nr:signal peptide peptidase SppA [Bryobacteraceae bacterium]